MFIIFNFFIYGCWELNSAPKTELTFQQYNSVLLLVVCVFVLGKECIKVMCIFLD